MSIPKHIHYCWFGRGEKPDLVQRCIESWKEKLPEYKIQCWSEDNSPTEHPYLAKALSEKKYANAANFTRLEVLKEHGGIYLDTDVQVLQSFDRFLNDSCFFGFESTEHVNTAVIGCVAHHPFITDLLFVLEQAFDGTEEANLSAPIVLTQVLNSRGVTEYRDEPFTVDDVTLYPKRFFYPYCWNEEFHESCITDETYAIHFWSKLW